MTFKVQSSIYQARFSYIPDCPLLFVNVHMQDGLQKSASRFGLEPVKTDLHVNQQLINAKVAVGMTKEEIAKVLNADSLCYQTVRHPVSKVISSEGEILEFLHLHSPRVAGVDIEPQGNNSRALKETPTMKIWKRFITPHLPKDARTRKGLDPRSGVSDTSRFREGAANQGSGDSHQYRDTSDSVMETSQENTEDSQPEKMDDASKVSGTQSPVNRAKNVKFKVSEMPTRLRTEQCEGVPGPSVDIIMTKYQHMRFVPANPKLQKGESFQFIMSYIEDPSNFFIHIACKETNESITKLERKLKVYAQKGNLPAPLSKLGWPIEPQDACVAQFSDDKQYYRAEILETCVSKRSSPKSPSDHKSNVQYRVRYVDYGNEEVVSRKKVFPLPPDIAEIPVQSVCCRLAGVVPIGGTDAGKEEKSGRWLLPATKWFTEHTGYVKNFTAYMFNEEEATIR